MTERTVAAATVLIVDDEASHREILQRSLQQEGYHVLTAGTGEEALTIIGTASPDVVLLDMKMPGLSGMEVLTRVKGRSTLGGGHSTESPSKSVSPATRGDRGSRVHPRSPEVIMVSALDHVELVIDAMQHGAYDYLTKPYVVAEIPLVVAKALEHRQLSEAVVALEHTLLPHHDASPLVGRQRSMLEIYKTIGRVAGQRSTVLITGESGTGKELVARLLHTTGPWKDQPFIPVDCASLPQSLIESELFGHEKGSFTGAIGQVAGKFETAKDGTVFLDEIGNIELDVQAKLLRVLQDRKFTRVGGHAPLTCQARIVAATNVNLEAAVRDGRFREDLYYRLAVVQIPLPPLRDRLDDLSILVQHFLLRHAGEDGRAKRVTAAAMTMLRSYHWPGNVRELEHAVERAVALAKGLTLGPEDFSLAALRSGPARESGAGSVSNTEGFGVCTLAQAVEAIERAWIQEALRQSHGIQTKAAQLLGVSLRILRYKMKRYHVRIPE